MAKTTFGAVRALQAFVLTLASTGIAAGQARQTFTEVDCRQARQPLVKEPSYSADPLYALFVMDLAGDFRTWAVLDKTDPALPHYDVVFFDANGNGDLTEPGERFVGRYEERIKSVVVSVGDLPVPGTEIVHTDLQFETTDGIHGYKGVFMKMKWDGQIEISGGLAKDGTEMTTYAASSEKAPVLRPAPLGLLSFIFFTTDVTIRVGKSTDIQVGIGKEGSGTDTICTVSEHFLEPPNDTLIATLIARDADGNELRSRNELKQHC